MRSIELLVAVAAGRVTRIDDHRGGYFAGYALDGVEIDRRILRSLANRRLIDMPMMGAPKVTEDGALLLRQRGEQ